jgi:hypothetical protein
MMPDEEKTQDNVQSAPVSEWTERQRWEAETRLKLRAEYETLLETWKLTALADTRKEYDKVASEGIKKLFEEWKKEQVPPTHEEIQVILNQEYESFELPIVSANGDGEVEHKSFTIRELPQAAEKKFYKQFKEKLLSKVSMLSAFDQENMNATFENKAKAMLEVIDDGFDVLADAVVIILNPFGKKQEINREWVQSNISSDRQWRIVEAQLKVNRLKDFFFKVSQSGQSMTTTMTGQSFLQLQQLAR